MTRLGSFVIVAFLVGIANCTWVPSLRKPNTDLPRSLTPLSRTFSKVEFRTLFTLMSQFSNGNAPTCPLYVEHQVEPTYGNENKGSYFILHNSTKAGGMPGGDENKPAADLLNQCTDDGYLEVFHSFYLRGGLVLDELRDAIDVDLTSLWQHGTTASTSSSNSEFTYLSALFESVWRALKGRQWWAGKEHYEIGEDGPTFTNGRTCGTGSQNRHFYNGELFLFIDEPETVTMLVALDAVTTAPVRLNGNQRYMIVVGESSTCIYNVGEDTKMLRNSDATQCPANCTCQC